MINRKRTKIENNSDYVRKIVANKWRTGEHNKYQPIPSLAPILNENWRDFEFSDFYIRFSNQLLFILCNMGILDRLEIENFKSYAGKQVIGPFKQFTCIIGPNGSGMSASSFPHIIQLVLSVFSRIGKSNLMDAISFVLCDVSRNLRGQTIADLIYHVEGDPNPAKTASVSLIYRVTDDQLEGFQENDEIVFSRYITSRGTSHYRYNNKDISQEDYIKKLESINILVRAKNFLIFQGEIQNISNQSPYELSQLVETISGSSKYKDKYNEYRGKIEEMNMKINNVAFDKKSLQMEKDKVCWAVVVV